MAHQSESANKPDWRRIIVGFTIELLIYGLLLLVYFLLVLRYLSEPLMRIFSNQLTLYAAAALGLIVAQGVVLDGITSFLVRLFGLDHFD